MQTHIFLRVRPTSQQLFSRTGLPHILPTTSARQCAGGQLVLSALHGTTGSEPFHLYDISSSLSFLPVVQALRMMTSRQQIKYVSQLSSEENTSQKFSEEPHAPLPPKTLPPLPSLATLPLLPASKVARWRLGEAKAELVCATYAWSLRAAQLSPARRPPQVDGLLFGPPCKNQPLILSSPIETGAAADAQARSAQDHTSAVATRAIA